MTVDGLGCLIWWELGFQPEIVDLRIIKKKKKKWSEGDWCKKRGKNSLYS